MSAVVSSTTLLSMSTSFIQLSSKWVVLSAAKETAKGRDAASKKSHKSAEAQKPKLVNCSNLIPIPFMEPSQLGLTKQSTMT